jgi:radical SAM protein with 4Fe4S-binding SPASM domain
MCDIWELRTTEELTIEEIETWMPEWQAVGVERVVLSGGEPLMYSAFDALGELFLTAGIGVSLISTGLLLERRAEAVGKYCDDVIVSLDGPPEVHDRIRRVPRAYERLARGVAAVRAVAPGICISARCTVLRENAGTLTKTVDAAKRLGLERLSFLAADVSSEAFNRPGGWAPDRAAVVALDGAGLHALRGELDALARDYADDFASGVIAESIEKLERRLYHYFAAILGKGAFPSIECNAPWVSAVVESDGTVRPCFFHASMGSAREAGGFEVVLNSDEAVAWRRGLDMSRNEICRRCVCSLALRRGAEPARAV